MARRRKMDWVPCFGYGVTLTANAAETAARELLQLPDFAAVDSVGLVEDTDDLFIHRIVGFVAMSNGHATSDAISLWRIMPLQADLETGVVQVPWDPVGTSLASGQVANFRFWAERFRTLLPGDSPENTSVDHPFWTQVDIHPKQAVGRRLNLWPSLVVMTGATIGPVRATPYLRLLVGYP